MDLTCPTCHRVNEATDGPRPGQTPEPGDVYMCWKCGGLGIFTALGVRPLTEAEELELTDDPQVRQLRAAIAETYTPAQASRLQWGTR